MRHRARATLSDRARVWERPSVRGRSGKATTSGAFRLLFELVELGGTRRRSARRPLTGFGA
jgi:hypothetical protein